MLHLQSFTCNPIQENSYLIYNDQKQCLFIDPGFYFPNEKQMIKDFVDQHQLQPVGLINTHCHLDHVFGNLFIAETYELKLQIHEKEIPVLDYAPVSGLTYNMPFDNYQGEKIFLTEGDVIRLGEDELAVLFTPGHSPGSLSFYCAAQDFVISGDALFKGSIGRTDLPGGDHATLIRSIKEKLLVLPASTKVYSGHGPVTTIEMEKRENPFLM